MAVHRNVGSCSGRSVYTGWSDWLLDGQIMVSKTDPLTILENDTVRRIRLETAWLNTNASQQYEERKKIQGKVHNSNKTTVFSPTNIACCYGVVCVKGSLNGCVKIKN